MANLSIPRCAIFNLVLVGVPVLAVFWGAWNGIDRPLGTRLFLSLITMLIVVGPVLAILYVLFRWYVVARVAKRKGVLGDQLRRTLFTNWLAHTGRSKNWG